MPSKLNQFPHSLAIVRKYFPKVKEVEEAEKPITVEVTAQDSKSSAVRNHDSCAMAVACKRKAHADGVIVSIGIAYIIKGEVATRYAVPPAIQREIVSFDREAGFAPGEYKLNPMRPSKRLGETRPRTHTVTGKKQPPPHLTSGIRTVLGSKE
jgi:hypothetical protein